MRALLVGLLVCGCGPVRGSFDLGVTTPVAVGSIVHLKPTSAVTARVGLTQTVRTPRDVTILSSQIEPADAWEKLDCAECRDAVRYRALRENLGTVTVRADDGLGVETFVKPIEAVTVNRVKLFDQPCDPLTWRAGDDFKLYFQLLSGDRVLADNGLGPESFAVEGGATLEGQPSALWVKTAKAAGVGRITSRIDPTLSVAFTVFTPAEVTGVDVVPYSMMEPPLVAGRTRTMRVPIEHPGAPACKDTFVRTVATATPDVCAIPGSATTASLMSDGTHTVMLQLKKAGTCTLTLGVQGTAITRTRDLTILEAPDAGTRDGG